MIHDAHGNAITVKEVPESMNTLGDINALAQTCTHLLLPSKAWLELAASKQDCWKRRWIADRALQYMDKGICTDEASARLRAEADYAVDGAR